MSCEGCAEPLTYSPRYRRMFDAHGIGPHWCEPMPEPMAAWAEAEVAEGYLAMREPMNAAVPPLREDPAPPKRAPEVGTETPRRPRTLRSMD